MLSACVSVSFVNHSCCVELKIEYVDKVTYEVELNDLYW